jgi:signal transduction histidine kinase
MAGRVLRPLRTITAAARDISARDLHQRLAMTGRQDEMKQLGDTFDGLLARLEAAFDAQRQFVANASHELRTPLARQRTLLEVALADPTPTATGLRTVCRRVLAAGEQQERLIEALLTLARTERGLDRREPLDLRAITGSVIEARRAEAEARSVSIDTDLGPATVLGDVRLAERMVANLVDNAIRHNVPGGTVTITTGAGAATVTNTGPVIPPDELDQLFQPFTRLAGRVSNRTAPRVQPNCSACPTELTVEFNSRERVAAPDGLGLGLPIVAAIVTAHEGRLDARPLPTGGLTVTVRLLADVPTHE